MLLSASRRWEGVEGHWSWRFPMSKLDGDKEEVCLHCILLEILSFSRSSISPQSSAATRAATVGGLWSQRRVAKVLRGINVGFRSTSTSWSLANQSRLTSLSFWSTSNLYGDAKGRASFPLIADRAKPSVTIPTTCSPVRRTASVLSSSLLSKTLTEVFR